jgi:hypothetical protein
MSASPSTTIAATILPLGTVRRGNVADLASVIQDRDNTWIRLDLDTIRFYPNRGQREWDVGFKGKSSFRDVEGEVNEIDVSLGCCEMDGDEIIEISE